MKKFWNTIFLGVSLILAQTSLAGPGHPGHSHAHEVDSAGAEQAARSIVERLIQKQKIATSWKAASLGSSEKKRFGEQTEWVVSFKNAGAQDPSKQTLYIFLNLEGKYLAANFTGK